MAIREIIEVPDPRLKLVSKPVEPEEFNEELKALVFDQETGLFANFKKEAAKHSVEGFGECVGALVAAVVAAYGASLWKRNH